MSAFLTQSGRRRAFNDLSLKAQIDPFQALRGGWRCGL